MLLTLLSLLAPATTHAREATDNAQPWCRVMTQVSEVPLMAIEPFTWFDISPATPEHAQWQAEQGNAWSLDCLDVLLASEADFEFEFKVEGGGSFDDTSWLTQGKASRYDVVVDPAKLQVGPLEAPLDLNVSVMARQGHKSFYLATQTLSVLPCTSSYEPSATSSPLAAGQEAWLNQSSNCPKQGFRLVSSDEDSPLSSSQMGRGLNDHRFESSDEFYHTYYAYSTEQKQSTMIKSTARACCSYHDVYVAPIAALDSYYDAPSEAWLDAAVENFLKLDQNTAPFAESAYTDPAGYRRVNYWVVPGSSTREQIGEYGLIYRVLKTTGEKYYYVKKVSILDPCTSDQITFISANPVRIQARNKVISDQQSVSLDLFSTLNVMFYDGENFVDSLFFDQLSEAEGQVCGSAQVTIDNNTMVPGLSYAGQGSQVVLDLDLYEEPQYIEVHYSLSFEHTAVQLSALTSEFMIGDCNYSLNRCETWPEDSVTITFNPELRVLIGLFIKCEWQYVFRPSHWCGRQPASGIVDVFSAENQPSVAGTDSSYRLQVLYDEITDYSWTATVTGKWQIGSQFEVSSSPITLNLNIKPFTSIIMTETMTIAPEIPNQYDVEVPLGYPDNTEVDRDEFTFQYALSDDFEGIIEEIQEFFNPDSYIQWVAAGEFLIIDWELAVPSVKIGSTKMEVCSPWQLSLSGTEVSAPIELQNSYDETLTATLPFVCKYAMCSNSALYAASPEMPEFSGFETDESMAPQTAYLYMPFTLEIPDVLNVCPEDHITFTQRVENSKSLTYADGTQVLDSELVLEDLGVSLARNSEGTLYLTVDARDSALSGASLSLSVRMTTKEDSDWYVRRQVQVLIAMPPCRLTQDDLDLVEVADVSLDLQATQDSVTDTIDLSDAIEQVSSALKVAQYIGCGSLTYTVVNTDARESMLSVDLQDKQLILEPTDQDEVGQYMNEVLRFSFEAATHLAYDLPISATVTSSQCVVTTVSFEQRSTTVTYQIDSGPQNYSVPTTVQSPECGNEYELQLEFVEAASEEVKKAIAFDSEARTVTVDTSSLALTGSTVNLKISNLVEASIKSDSYLMSVSFEAGPPAFDLTGLVMTPLTCSTDDATWSFQLPPVLSPDLQSVVLQLTRQSPDSFFEYLEAQQILIIAKDKRNRLFSGQLCPSQVSVDFNIVSDLLGEGDHEFVIPVEPKSQEGSQAAFKGVSVGGEEADEQQEEVEALQVEKLWVSIDGKLTLDFNKPIIKPSVKIGAQIDEQGDGASEVTKEGEEADDGDDSERRLEAQLYDIKDLISVRVKDSDDYDDLDKALCDLSLNQVSEKQLQISLTFCTPEDITLSEADPDILLVKFELPNLIIDAENFQQLGLDQVSFEVEVQPQLSQAAYASLMETAVKVAKVGVTLTVWQIILCFFLGKALHAMWILINCLQFVVYMSLWRINLPSLTKLILGELKRIVLAEFMDDVDMGQKLISKLGIETKSDTSGESPLAETDMLGSLGPTLILLSAVFLTLIIVGMCTIYFCRACSCSTKRLECVVRHRHRVFYNPIIRYTMLNALKLNLTAVVTVRAFDQVTYSTLAFACFWLLVLNVAPLLYARLLYKQRDFLHKEAIQKRFGTLYQGMTLLPKQRRLDRPVPRIYLFTLLFFARRLAFVAITAFGQDFPAEQLMVNILLSGAVTIYLTQGQLFESKLRTVVEVFSELCLMTLSALALQCCDTRNSLESREIIGQCMMGVLGLLVVVNVGFVLRTVHQNRKESKRAKKMLRDQECYRDHLIKLRDQQQLLLLQLSLDKEEEQKQQQDRLQSRRAKLAKIRAQNQLERRRIQLRGRLQPVNEEQSSESSEPSEPPRRVKPSEERPECRNIPIKIPKSSRSDNSSIEEEEKAAQFMKQEEPEKKQKGIWQEVQEKAQPKAPPRPANKHFLGQLYPRFPNEHPPLSQEPPKVTVVPFSQAVPIAPPAEKKPDQPRPSYWVSPDANEEDKPRSQLMHEALNRQGVLLKELQEEIKKYI